MENKPFEHPGDTNSAVEFGFDLDIPEDRETWATITGEVAIISDYSTEEAAQIQVLVDKGHTREIAVQTVLYERLG